MNLIAFCLSTLGYILIFVGGGATMLILVSVFLSGASSLDHGYPILIFSTLLLIVGILLLWLVRRTKRI